jgi:hypothetical protein
MLRNPQLRGAGEVATATGKHIGQEASNFAQRQFHGLTGYGGKDLKYLDRIGIAGEHSAAEKAKVLGLHAEDKLRHHARTVAGMNDPYAQAHGIVEHSRLQKSVGDELVSNVKNVHEEGALGQRFQNLGMTSMPGSVKAVVTNPRESSKLIWDQMRGGGGGLSGPGGSRVGAMAGIGLGVGLPVAFAAHDISKGDESATGGRNIKQKILNAGVNTGVGLATGGVGILPQMVAGMGIDKATDWVGRKFLGNPGAPAADPARYAQF